MIIVHGKFTYMYTFIQIEKGLDYIKIYDGGSQYSEVVANLSGIYNQTKVSIPGNQVFINFEVNSKFNNKIKGFNAFILEKGNTIYIGLMTLTAGGNSKIISLMIVDDACEYWMDMEKMTLTSPDYPNWYKANGVGCEWVIAAPKGSIITIEFIYFEVVV